MTKAAKIHLTLLLLFTALVVGRLASGDGVFEPASDARGAEYAPLAIPFLTVLLILELRRGRSGRPARSDGEEDRREVSPARVAAGVVVAAMTSPVAGRAQRWLRPRRRAPVLPHEPHSHLSVN